MRGKVVVLAASEKAVVTVPLPVDPDVIVSHELLLVAVQEQPLVVVSVALPVPAVDAGLREVGDTLNEQAAPAWVTVTV